MRSLLGALVTSLVYADFKWGQEWGGGGVETKSLGLVWSQP